MNTTPRADAEVPSAATVPGDVAVRAWSHRAGDEFWDLVVNAQRHRTTGLASQFAYNAFIATVPMLLTLIAAVRLLAGQGATNRVVKTYNEEIPTAYQSALHSLLTSALRDQNRTVAVLILAAIGAVYLAGNAVGAMIVGLDAARGTPDRPWVVGKLVGIRIAAVWIVLATVVNLIILLGQNGEAALARQLSLSTSTRNTLHGLVFFGGTLILLVMMWELYRRGPNAPMRHARAYVAGFLVAAALIVGFTQLFAGYVDQFGGFSVYGALLGVVIYLTLLWGVGAAVLIGAEINEQMARRRAGERPQPRRWTGRSA